jgi:MtfA peptidase
MIFDWFRQRRRRRLLSEPFPEEWRAALARNVIHYSYLSADEQSRLRDLLRIFAAERHWEGCGGFEINDEIKVTIAAHACMMLLGMEHDHFSSVSSILVYKSDFQLPRQHMVGSLVVAEDVNLVGQAVYHGPVVLAWRDVRRAGRRPHSGRNVVWHEFAHQLDMLDSGVDGTPPLRSRDQLQRWQTVMTAEFEQLIEDSESGRPTLLDDYGATNEAEFFAVVTEFFFDVPGLLRDEHPQLYALLAEYYGQDPAARVPPEAYDDF